MRFRGALSSHAWVALVALALPACGDDEQPGVAASIVAVDSSSSVDVAADTAIEHDSAPPEVSAPETLSDTTPGDDAVDQDTGVPPADSVTTAETVEDTGVVAVDTVSDADAVVDTAPADVGPPIPVADCPVQPMSDLYSGFLPPNPFAAWPPADPCVAAKHDVIIVLGCPNKEDGQPDTCQIKRADIAIGLMQQGYGDRFITSGGAVHTPFVEAHTLRDLLVERGVSADRIYPEPQAEHTDENLFYSSQIMAQQGWTTAMVVSDSPGHLMMTAVCDSNCCVNLGRLTLFEFPVDGGVEKAGHYVLFPAAASIAADECDTIEATLKFMCVNLDERRACMGDLQLP